MTNVTVCAKRRWNDTKLDLREGDPVRITASGAWTDWTIPTDPGGFEKPHLAWLRWTRRCRDARWFELVAVIGKSDGPYHRIGREGRFTADRSGRLYLFANDAWIMYWNNKGAIEAEVTLET